MSRSIMDIIIHTHDRSVLEGKTAYVAIIPFGGEVKSDLFQGKILPGAVDRQIIDANGIKHMSARYMLEGTDSQGNSCKIYIENSGDFSLDGPRPFRTIPIFYTDSPVLADYLHTNRFRGEGHREGDVLTIKIFDLWETTT
ncbi:MAG: DUF3237 family protein [Eubacteriales bacterium]